MSFILDALRKSEHERQRQAGPMAADLRTAAPPKPGFPVWAVTLGALLAVNLVVILALLVRGEFKKSDPVPPPAATSAPVATSPGVVDLVAEPVLPPPNSQPRSLDANSGNKRRAAVSWVPDSHPSAVGPQLQTPAYVPPEPEKESAVGLPTFNDVKLQGGEALPELRLDMHVYARRVADRFVFINMRKYREGDQTTEGMTVERITPQGVVLDHRGTRFLLPHQ